MQPIVNGETVAQKIRPSAASDLEAWYRASPLWSFVPRFIKLAETNADDPAAIDALLWVTDLAVQRVVIVQELLPLYGRAVELLLEHDRIDDPRVGQACLRGLRYDSPPSEQFLRIVMDKSRNREVRGRACVALARLLHREEAHRAQPRVRRGGEIPPSATDRQENRSQLRQIHPRG